MRGVLIALCAAVLCACVSGGDSRGADAVFRIANDGRCADYTPALLRALDSAKKLGGKRRAVIEFERGVYRFGGNFAPDMFVFTSNNDSGLKRVIFPIADFENLAIEGNGAKFVFEGRVSPFVIRNSRGVFLRGFTCDLARSGHSEAVVLDVFDGGAVLKMKDNMPYEISRGCLMFTGGEFANSAIQKRENYLTHRFMVEFDPSLGRIERNTGNCFANDAGAYRADDLGGGKFRLYHPKLAPRKGNVVVFSLGRRENPMFAVDESAGITFANITIHDAYGMGIIAQNTRDITVKNCVVRAGEGRVASCAADATHFVNCEGKITIDGCVFEHQLDDATNIHGIYERVAKIEGDGAILTELVHYQQYGFKTFKAGDTIEFVDGESMRTKGLAKIKSVETINKQFKRVVLDGSIPAGARVSDAVAKVRDYPEVSITNNIFRNNIARGLLLNCRGKTRVENNVFSTSGSALYFEGDASHWFEQGGVRDCVIRGNVFENCKYARYGRAVIEVAAGISKERETSRYNRNIVIENNTFKALGGVPLLKIYCVDNLKWRDNAVETTSAPPRTGSAEQFIVEHCSNIDIR